MSFEVENDVAKLIDHSVSMGFSKFKLINQTSFRALGDEEKLIDRIRLKAINFLGYKDSRFVRRNGRFFLLMHSSAPAPWASDGAWQSGEDVMLQWQIANEAGQKKI